MDITETPEEIIIVAEIAGVETENDERPIPLLDDSLNGMTERRPRSEAFENFVKSNGSGHRYQRLLRMDYLLSAISLEIIRHVGERLRVNRRQ